MVLRIREGIAHIAEQWRNYLYGMYYEQRDHTLALPTILI